MKVLSLLILFVLNIFIYFFLCLTPVFSDMKSILSNSIKVEFVSPKEGERVHGKISIQALVNYPEKVNYIDFYFQEPGARDRYSWKAYSPPYFWGGQGQKLDTTLFNDGPASAVAFCYPQNSRSPMDPKRVHFIIDNGKPKVRILSPPDDASLRGNVLIHIDAKDPKGIKREAGIIAVYIYIDGGLFQKLTKTPFVAPLETCLLAPGLHSIRVVAEDTEGLTSEESIMVSVERGGSALGNKDSLKP